MRRKLFTLCSSVSLLLCVAVCVLWVISSWRTPPGVTRASERAAGHRPGKQGVGGGVSEATSRLQSRPRAGLVAVCDRGSPRRAAVPRRVYGRLVRRSLAVLGGVRADGDPRGAWAFRLC